MHHKSVNQLMNCSSSDSKNKRHDQLKKAQKTHFETVNFYSLWMYSQLQLRVWQSECDAERDYAIETGNGPDFKLYSVADVLIIFCLVAFACLWAPQPSYRKFGRVIISRGRISTGENKSYSSSLLHGNNLSMNVIPNWIFQSFCVSLRLNWAF